MHEAPQVRERNQVGDICKRAAEVHLVMSVIESEKHGIQASREKRRKPDTDCDGTPPARVQSGHREPVEETVRPSSNRQNLRNG